MFHTLFTMAVLAASAVANPLAPRALPPSGTVSVTPHDMYSSSIGVLGCKINTNRVAYWPAPPGCDGMCIQLTYQGRSLYVLHVDQSGGAYDISYGAWNKLLTGQAATVDPQQGGGLTMDYVVVPMSNCADLLTGEGGKLPLSAANSMNYYASCAAQPSSWAAKNSALYNIADPVCKWGIDELCTVNLAAGQNQPTCPHQLGLMPALGGSDTVYNIQYGTGKLVAAQ